MLYFYLHVFYLRCLFQLFGLNTAPFQQNGGENTENSPDNHPDQHHVKAQLYIAARFSIGQKTADDRRDKDVWRQRDKGDNSSGDAGHG